MNSKKGVIEVQFNWIFVLIIGSVILILITGVVIKQKNISETSKNTLILKNLDQSIKSLLNRVALRPKIVLHVYK